MNKAEPGRASGSAYERENDNLRPPPREGRAPRPSTEPPGAEPSVKTGKTRTDPGSGESEIPDAPERA